MDIFAVIRRRIASIRVGMVMVSSGGRGGGGGRNGGGVGDSRGATDGGCYGTATAA